MLGNAGRYDLCSSSGISGGDALSGSIYPSILNGRKVMLFKTLMSNTCAYDCKYCQNPICKRPVMYEPEELASVFGSLVSSNTVEGLFLSSGIVKDSDYTMQKMIEGVKLIRNSGFRGYVHLKILPGVSKDLVMQAGELADRMSVNLEAPSKQRLSELSSTKDFDKGIVKVQKWIGQANPRLGQTTQMIVGAGGETDLEILKTAEWEYEDMDMIRVYYSSFIPIKGTPLESREAAPKSREHRLYCVDFMMRKYGIPLSDFKEIMQDGNLPSGDPKIALALKNCDEPVDLKTVDYGQLLRIPGIGPVKAYCIMAMQEYNVPLDQKAIRALGLSRAEPFLKLGKTSQKRLKDY